MKFNFYLLFSIFLMLGSFNSFAQIGIGTKTPAASAALEVTSSTNNKGILIPRITATQKDAILSPAEGLLVYQTTSPTGFYYYAGGAWKLMAIQTDLAGKVDKVDGKNLSSNDYTTAEKTKLSAITGSNTGDQTTITGNAGTATKLATARNINGVAFDGSSDITITAAADAGTLSGTALKSTVTGSSLTSVGTLANLTVTNPIAGSITGNAATATTAGTATTTTGNAGTATKLATPKNINGVAFDGSSDITIAADAGTLSGTALKSTLTGSSLTSVGTLGNLTVTNPIAGSVTGNAGTATKLAATKNINGVAFDGSADITVPAAVETLTGTTLKSTVTGSSLTSVGTLGNLTVTNPIAGSVTGTANNVNGTVAVANGGTGSNTLTGLIIGNGTNPLSNLVGSSSGDILKWNGNSWGLTGSSTLAIGNNAGLINQGSYSIALGQYAGLTNQSDYSVALGYNAANNNQGSYSIALGERAGYGSQGTRSIALGQNAGYTNQGTNSIALGYGAGYFNQSENSIVINASGYNVDANSSGFYVKPIRSIYSSFGSVLKYNYFNGEITYDGAKTFVINHPTKPDSYLVHSCLEGPEAGVYYRGESKIENNKSVTVTLPDYVNALANNFSIQITTIYEDDADENIVYRTSRVKNNMFNVYGKNGSFYWIVYGQRAKIEVEPIKAAVEIAGEGPYKYINRKK